MQKYTFLYNRHFLSELFFNNRKKTATIIMAAGFIIHLYQHQLVNIKEIAIDVKNEIEMIVEFNLIFLILDFNFHNVIVWIGY